MEIEVMGKAEAIERIAVAAIKKRLEVKYTPSGVLIVVDNPRKVVEDVIRDIDNIITIIINMSAEEFRTAVLRGLKMSKIIAEGTGGYVELEVDKDYFAEFADLWVDSRFSKGKEENNAGVGQTGN